MLQRPTDRNRGLYNMCLRSAHSFVIAVAILAGGERLVTPPVAAQESVGTLTGFVLDPWGQECRMSQWMSPI